MAESFYNNSFFPSLQVKSPDVIGALSAGSDLGQKIYTNQALPGLMTAANQGDTNAMSQAQAIAPAAAYQAALGNQAQTTAQQTKLLTVARLSNGLKSALDNSADDTAKQAAIDAFDNLAKQSGLPENPMLSDPNTPMDKKVAWVNNTAQQTQSTMMAGSLGKGVSSATVQSLVASGVPYDQALQQVMQEQARITTDSNGNVYQPSLNGPKQFNPVTGGATTLGGGGPPAPRPALSPPPPQPVASSAPSTNSPMYVPPVTSAPLPIDGSEPVIPGAGGAPINAPKPTIQGLSDLAQQPSDSIQIPQKPVVATIDQAKQTSLQTPGKAVDLPNGGFIVNGKYYDSVAKTNPAQEQKTFDKVADPYVDPKDGLDAQIKAAQNSINLAKQVQAISPSADSGELAGFIQKGKSSLESLGLLPPNSNASNNDVMKGITGEYLAGIMGGENNVKNIRNQLEFKAVTAQAPDLLQTQAGREKIAALTEAVAQAKLQSAQQYQQAVQDRTIQDPDVKKQLQDSYGASLDAIPVYGISHYDDSQYANEVRRSLERPGVTKQQIIQKIQALAPK